MIAFFQKLNVCFLSIIFLFSGSLICAQDSIERIDNVSESVLNQKDNALVWKFYRDGKQDTSYLFGTIHIPIKSAFQAVDTVLDLMQKVDKVFFEIAFEPEDLMKTVNLLMATDSVDKIENILNPEDFERLQNKLESLYGAQATLAVKNLKPFGVISMFSNAMLPSDTTFAMDIAFQQYAKSLGKEVDGLETVEEQLAIFDSISQENKKLALLDYLDNYDEQVNEFEVLLNAYLSEDLAKMKALTDSAFTESKYISKANLLTNRNEKMANSIHSIAYYDKALIGVGAAHLVGEDGLLSLLRQKGYTLEPIRKQK